MVDFFELLHGQSMETLPHEATLSAQQAHHIVILGKHYTEASWVRFGTMISPWLAGGQIVSMYTVNNEVYLVMDVYPELYSESSSTDASLKIDATAKPERQVVATSDLLYINGMWSVGQDEEGQHFIEMSI